MCDFALARKLRGARTVELSKAATAVERLLCTLIYYTLLCAEIIAVKIRSIRKTESYFLSDFMNNQPKYVQFL